MERKRLPLALALAALAPAAVAAGPQPERVTVVYAADVGGYLEPCGCSEDQRGGLPRAAEVLRRIRAEGHPVVFVAGGDLLFEERPDGAAREQALLKARAVGEALRRMRLDAAVAGERDLFAGEAFAREAGLPLARGKRVGPVGFGELGAVPAAPIRLGVVHEAGTRGALARADEAQAAGVTLLLGSHRDSLLSDDFNRAVVDAPVPAVQVQGRGQSLARIDFWLRGDPAKGFAVLPGAAQRDEEVDLALHRRLEYLRRRDAALAAGGEELARALGAKIAELDARVAELRAAPVPAPPSDRPSLQVSFIPLTQDLPEDASVRQVVVRYYAEAGRRNLARARAEKRPCPPAAEGEPRFIGVDRPPPGGAAACASCHPAAVAQWRATPHARAYATLEKAGRQHDLDCIACHVTGWRRPGGACSVASDAGRRDVQCEACHGPASRHAADPPGHIERVPPEERCRSCHTPEHSTRFEPASYGARVIGAGHGRPPTTKGP
ncbi:MAG TPA: multiheme c-type cytochrome [Anaeromyxobacteraceae bacterium]|nr:multiheme c-type cytochrome [Anaeromyxobacteraceae bacterium]